MTHFEIVIIILLYLFCYGYTTAMFIKEENTWLRIVLCLVSLVLALYAPLYIGGAVFEKLNNNKS
jgi:hypothetical protein